MEPTLDQWIHRRTETKYSDFSSSSTGMPLTGGKSGTENTLPVLYDGAHDFAILESSQTQWIVRAHDELHPWERLAETAHDAHPPPRVEVRAELIDQHDPLGSFQCSKLRGHQPGHDITRQSQDRLIAIAQLFQAEVASVEPYPNLRATPGRHDSQSRGTRQIRTSFSARAT